VIPISGPTGTLISLACGARRRKRSEGITVMTDDRSSTLSSLSTDLEAAVAAAATSTVRVDARRRLPASGIVWDPHVIVTAAHVLERDEDISVGLPNGDVAAAALAGRDAGSDIAVLRVPDVALDATDWSDDVAVGRIVVAVGRPGRDHEVALGIIRAIGGSWRARGGVPVEGYLRTDATMYPGFSGGPLADASGRILGMNTSRYATDDGFTVPTMAARPIIEALLRDGQIRPAYIGVASQTVALTEAVAGSLPGVFAGQGSGLLVAGVEPGTPSDAAGLLQGDVIVGLAGQPIRDTDELMAELLPGRVGEALPVLVVRGGASQELSITPVDRPEEAAGQQGRAHRHGDRGGRRFGRG